MPSPAPSIPIRRSFTLIEVILAIVLVAILLTAIFAAVSNVVRARDSNRERADAFNRAWLAVDVIALDTMQCLRAGNLLEAKVHILPAGPSSTADGLLLFSHGSRPVRAGQGQAEGDEIEAQFRLEPAQRHNELWRRAQPVPDVVTDGGGVASPITPGIAELTVEAFDGNQWFRRWDSDSDGLPHAIRITVVAFDDSGKTSAVARRIVAIDRVPIPPADEAEPSTSGSTSSSVPRSSGRLAALAGIGGFAP
jgi:type II secretion system protein J